MTANNLLMQSLADVLDVPVVRPIVAETVSLGRRLRRRTGGRVLARPRQPRGRTGTRRPSGCRRWIRAMRDKGYRKWKKAVARAVDWVDDDD